MFAERTSQNSKPSRDSDLSAGFVKRDRAKVEKGANARLPSTRNDLLVLMR